MFLLIYITLYLLFQEVEPTEKLSVNEKSFREYHQITPPARGGAEGSQTLTD